ncbi:hypothetical protein [Paraburkholderia acidiphila]|uniref:Uncharacterized protein n=1 Tax=Paraburkholderia acidiphila TaxID=2571747 RepID=A0A7Z2J785_9BURK|nr:hypothetical protein [Paraburkholderia acidiphila]QGZ54292.1 hypothetical protein FAZ97_04820 [Paraburkholderia acidiphila]
MSRKALARPEQTLTPPLRKGDRVRNSCATRVGVAVRVYPNGSAAVRWDDAPLKPGRLVHERVPRELLAAHEPLELNGHIRFVCMRALREAAMAPTVYDALDVAGEALRQLSGLPREGGHHA